MTPLNFNYFSNKPIVWLRFKSIDEDDSFITVFNNSGLVASNIFYTYIYLMGLAEWSEDRITWNEFFTE